jgi:hypothetical protein
MMMGRGGLCLEGPSEWGADGGGGERGVEEVGGAEGGAEAVGRVLGGGVGGVDPLAQVVQLAGVALRQPVHRHAQLQHPEMKSEAGRVEPSQRKRKGEWRENREAADRGI